eukprot:Tamp_21244.p2 GENE.Tamp_21244~~Tamp_21244.p2  ORF type:complete len:121 (-),score=5.22 Tamp_21244:203-565(-)
MCAAHVARASGADWWISTPLQTSHMLGACAPHDSRRHVDAACWHTDKVSAAEPRRARARNELSVDSANQVRARLCWAAGRALQTVCKEQRRRVSLHLTRQKWRQRQRESGRTAPPRRRAA